MSERVATTEHQPLSLYNIGVYLLLFQKVTPEIHDTRRSSSDIWQVREETQPRKQSLQWKSLNIKAI